MVRYCPECWGEMEANGVCRQCGRTPEYATAESYEDKLIWALRHPEPTTPIRAAAILGQRRSAAAVEALIAVAVTTFDIFLQEAAITALGQIGDERARPILEYFNDEGAVRVKLAAQRALASMEGARTPGEGGAKQTGGASSR